jgi:photosystem II stability/assembly factor-like uncharacterized protein
MPIFKVTLSFAMRSVLLLCLTSAAFASGFDPTVFSELHWRMIGPLRGGRTRALAGVPSQPKIFYIGAVNGGVWKTNDFGRSWNPVFDDQPTGSIGALAVAPSNPNIIYVGSGEGLQRPDLSVGDGIYKSTDAGKTWTHLGLRDGQQIPQIAIDPRDPNRLFVAVLGHPYGPNAERGLYRSTDGGQTFQKILYKDENTGASDVKLDPRNSDVVYAALWEARQGPWENGAFSGNGGGIFKSTDGGEHWKPLTQGLPSVAEGGVVQANLAVSPSDPNRLFAALASAHSTAIYRSDDAGESWTNITSDPRPAERIGGGDLPVPVVDPKNPDVVYIASTVTMKSIDGGKTWTALRGAPGGDDYQGIWIDPTDTAILLLVSDQGAIITVNGGETWSSWYNQPTAQMYHAAADNAFPYRVCGGQQESGSACVSSRGPYGEITARDWSPVGLEEYGYAAPDPLDPDLVYGGKVTRYDRRTGQVLNVSPKPFDGAGYRALRTAPVMFSPVDPHVLYFAANTLWKTRDGGIHWSQISPDLTRKNWEVPASVGKYKGTPEAKISQRGVIYALAPSPLDINRLWAGTDDGLIHVTVDGGVHWKNVTPPALGPFSKVSILDAGHFDAGTAYAAINTLRLDDLRPHILRTHDGGKSWTETIKGIPDGAPVDVVREDPKRKGLLYAGTERGVYVSFDDGDNWQSLRLNMPATSIRDLIVKDDDLIAATHGRGFWILDDVTPLRQINARMLQANAALFKPQTALRVRWDVNTDTPLPPDEPAGQNPPEGAIIDYYLQWTPSGALHLDILDHAGKVIRCYASNDKVERPDPKLAIPQYWVRTQLRLSNKPGLHRFLWDLHYDPVPGERPEYPMQAVVHDTAIPPASPWAMPGTYTVRLTAGDETFNQQISVKMDPRVKTSLAGLQHQFILANQLYEDQLDAVETLLQIRLLREKLTRDHQPDKEAKVAALVQPFNQSKAALGAVMQTVEETDYPPTPAVAAAAAERHAAFVKLIERWKALL